MTNVLIHAMNQIAKISTHYMILIRNRVIVKTLLFNFAPNQSIGKITGMNREADLK